MTHGRGEVYDIGYQRYVGPREGRMRARKTVFVDGVRTALGLGRSPLAKLLPALLFLAAITPAAVFALINLVADQLPGDLPGHAGYYQIVSIILLLFSAIIAPELLCPDRRDGVINLYLVRPMSATDYVSGRWLAFFSITLALVYSGQVVLLIGLVLGAAEPLDYLRENWLDVPRFLAAGLFVALFTTTLPMAVSAFTTRRAYAAAFVVGLSVVASPVAAGLTDCGESPRIQGTVQDVGLEGAWSVTGSMGFVDREGNFHTMGEEVVAGEGRFVFGPPREQQYVVAVDADTVIEPGAGVGYFVEVEFIRRRDGSLLARRIGAPSAECRPVAGDYAKWVGLVDLFRTPIHLSDMIFGEENQSSVSYHVATLPDVVPIAWYLLLTSAAGLALWWRYQRLMV